MSIVQQLTRLQLFPNHRVLSNSGSGSWSGVIAGVNYFAANGSSGDVANMSLGGGKYQALNDAVIAATNNNKWVVMAAGNSNADTVNYSPASAQCTRCVTVSSQDSNGCLSSFSNYGSEIDVAAPGRGIKSTWPGNSGYTTNTISGTSMASPHAAGVILVNGDMTTNGNVNCQYNGNDGINEPIIHF